ncbi:MAG: hypothetical protein ACK5M4_11015 [Pseudorhodobacter sp.]
MIKKEDLRAAVGQGIVTAEQAASLIALASNRRNAVESAAPGEEPFTLFRGFNEIFIVVGLTILFSAWSALAFSMVYDFKTGVGSPAALFMAALTLAGLALLSRYFTLKRRMVAPSIALAIMTAITTYFTGMILVTLLGLTGNAGQLLCWVAVALVTLAYYQIYRVPFSVLIIAVAVLWTLWAFLAQMGLLPPVGDLSGILQDRAVSTLSVFFGLLLFILAMRFDMSDPHRMTTRSATGFWLHVASAPLIVNIVALRLIDQPGTVPQITLLAFLLILAVIAVIIDRRSFLVSGAGYAVMQLFRAFDNSALAILVLGISLVLLGSYWERTRHTLMRTLPDFPGKSRLPPYSEAI